MSTDRLLIRGLAAADPNRVLMGDRPCELKPDRLDEIWLTSESDPDTPVRHVVTGRRVVATADAIRLDLFLEPYRPPLLARLSALPAPAPIVIGIALAATTVSPLLVGAVFLFLEGYSVLGWAAHNVDTAAGVSTAAFMLWLGMKQRYAVAQWYLMCLWLLAGVGVSVAVGELWPEVTGDEAIRNGYDALGRSIVDRREAVIATIGPYVPALVAFGQFVGLKGAALLIEKAWPAIGKGKP